MLCAQVLITELPSLRLSDLERLSERRTHDRFRAELKLRRTVDETFCLAQQLRRLDVKPQKDLRDDAVLLIDQGHQKRFGLILRQ